MPSRGLTEGGVRGREIVCDRGWMLAVAALVRLKLRGRDERGFLGDLHDNMVVLSEMSAEEKVRTYLSVNRATSPLET